MVSNQDYVPLSNQEIQRYSRQLIIPSYGINSQIRLKNKSALIIGCGGLGCPAALYLSTSGVGSLGLVDNDIIEISNIHRQIAHETKSIGRSKAQNLMEKCKSLNDQIIFKTHEVLFDKSVAISLISKYDIVLDCTDNVITRYLISDVCVLLNKPLVSGSALKFEGQLTVYNYLNGPCYRCLYAIAPAPETVSNCSDAGILGPIVGMIGSLQALECIKILTGIGSSLNGRMMIFDGLEFQTRVIKLRERQINTCVMCKHSIANQNDVEKSKKIIESFDYNIFCSGVAYNDKTININLLDNKNQRITCIDYKKIIDSIDTPHLLIDVRSRTQFEICSLPNAFNIPFDNFYDDKENTLIQIKEKLEEKGGTKKSIFIVCRLGNDSQKTVKFLNENFNESNVESIKDLIGGITAWSHTVDKNFPKY